MKYFGSQTLQKMGYLRNLEINMLLLKDLLRVGAYNEHIF
jgi:hypothetical protein